MVNGKLRSTSRAITKGKRVIDPKEKAISEATSRHKAKKQEILAKERYGVMLAHKFLEKEKRVTYPVIVQPKLDGCRAAAYRQGDVVMLVSRNGLPKRNPLVHIKEILLPLLDPNGKDFIDGELYSHGLARGKLVGICNKNTITPEYEKRTLAVYFHAFDYVRCDHPDDTFTERYEFLKQKMVNVNPIVKLVEIHDVVDRKEVMSYHDKFVSQGYEGVMIRTPDGLYQAKRSNALLKYKQFDDEEFEICGYHEGKADWEGTVIWECWYNKDEKLSFSAKQRGTKINIFILIHP